MRDLLPLIVLQQINAKITPKQNKQTNLMRKSHDHDQQHDFQVRRNSGDLGEIPLSQTKRIRSTIATTTMATH